MAYTPAWNALFAKPLLNQCIALIQRDQAAAIAIVNPALLPIAEFHKGPGLRTALPWLTVSLDGFEFDEDVLGTRQSRPRIALTLDAGQFDQEMAQDNAQDYARVLDMVITTASETDWETPLAISQETVPSGITSPNAAGTIKEIFVASHRYGAATLDEIQAPVLRVTLNLDFVLEET
ncbi:MAG TPA: hypothetical protein VG860_15885 [Terriglobia bacterium]|jgi:hypothetical protein|nr:hypothetical protein [Terriglobia bacterium]